MRVSANLLDTLILYKSCITRVSFRRTKCNTKITLLDDFIF